MGDRAWWAPGRPVVCLACRPEDSAAQPDRGAAMQEVKESAISSTKTQLDVGAAGGSAMREHQRRHQAREREIRRRWGKLSGLVLALTDDPQTTRAWRQGSLGESKLARALGRIDRDDVLILNDRKVPGSRGNIDHIVVAPTGIYVVDAKSYTGGQIEVRDVSRFFSAPDRRLFVGRRNCSRRADDMTRQVDAVRTALGERPDVAVIPVLCFVDARWPLFGGPKDFRGVRLDDQGSLRKAVCRAGSLGVDEVREIAVVLSHQLPSCVPQVDGSTAADGHRSASQ